MCTARERKDYPVTDEARRRFEQRIVVDPAIIAGKPVVKGTRIPVYIILQHLAHDLDLGTLFDDYPHLTLDDVKACLAYAAALVESDDVFPTFVTETNAAD
jgi:uncharacterized protein (DUF433 family)